ncbi:MAG: guanylate kinase [Bacteroidaceae bacterium]|nr:guanylate kinase [Bacteroidaceae bacterium]
MKQGYETANCAAYDLLRQFSQDNRKNQTEAESILWNALRASQCGVRFRRQHIIGEYIADFVCLSRKLIIEVDGAYHNKAAQIVSDEQRTEDLKRLGFRVMRFQNEEIIANIDKIVDKIEKEIKLEPFPPPSEGTGEAGRLLIVSAPSGSGKSTIVHYLMDEHPEFRLAFSVSATSRPPRGKEQDGVEYYFISPEKFREHIKAGDFLEYEEVYEDRFYGTLKSQVEEKLAAGWNVVFDVDVKGGINIKKYYGERALSIFIQPPSVEALRERLTRRNTDGMAQIEERLAKAEYEMSFAPQFDRIIVNDDLDTAKRDAVALLTEFLKPKQRRK